MPEPEREPDYDPKNPYNLPPEVMAKLPPILATAECAIPGVAPDAAYALSDRIRGVAWGNLGTAEHGRIRLPVETEEGEVRFKIDGYEETTLAWKGRSCWISGPLEPPSFVVTGTIRGDVSRYIALFADGCGARVQLGKSTAVRLEADADGPGCEVKIWGVVGELAVFAAPKVVEGEEPVDFDLVPSHVTWQPGLDFSRPGYAVDLADDGIHPTGQFAGTPVRIPPGMPDEDPVTSLDGVSVVTSDREAQLAALRAWIAAHDR